MTACDFFRGCLIGKLDAIYAAIGVRRQFRFMNP
jgi:hypothetical protein